MDVDLKEQISDLKSMLREVSVSLEKHLKKAGETELADRVRSSITAHHQYRTKRLDRVCAEAREVINVASSLSGGPPIEALEDTYGMRLPGRKKGG